MRNFSPIKISLKSKTKIGSHTSRTNFKTPNDDIQQKKIGDQDKNLELAEKISLKSLSDDGMDIEDEFIHDVKLMTNKNNKLVRFRNRFAYNTNKLNILDLKHVKTEEPINDLSISASVSQ